MAGIYRKAALDRLASPEQLDRQIQIVSPMVWIASASFFLVIAVVTVWGVFGSLPEKVEVGGVYTTKAQIQGLYTKTSGEIRLLTEKGTNVKKGEPIAKIESSELDAQISLLEQQRADLDKITLTSEGDASSTQVATLLEIKQKWQASGLTEEQYQAKLSKMQVSLASKTAEVQSLESQYEQVGSLYLESLGDDAKNTADYEMQEKKAAYESAAASYQTAVTNVQGAQQAYENALVTEGPDSPLTKSLLETLNGAKSMESNQKSAMDSAAAQFESAQASYKDVYTTQNQQNANTQNYYMEYNRLGQLYSSAYSAQKNIESQIESLKTQKAGDDVNEKEQVKSLEEQFTKTKEALQQELKVQIDENRQTLENYEMIAPYDGTVTEVIVTQGQVVAAGVETLRLKRSDDIGEGVICYVPLADARKLEKGMEVKVTPSSVKESEYGHMNGTVKEVGKYNATASEIRQMLGDELFVSGMQQQGPSVQVVIGLDKDASTVSGYAWSNKKGRKVELTDGTLVSANVIIAEKAPITKLLPYMKEKLKVAEKEKK